MMPIFPIRLHQGLLGQWVLWMHRVIHRAEHAKHMGRLMESLVTRHRTFESLQTGSFGKEGQRNREDISASSESETILNRWIRWKCFRTNRETYRSQDENVALVAGKSGPAKLSWLGWGQMCFIICSLCWPLPNPTATIAFTLCHLQSQGHQGIPTPGAELALMT